MSVHIPKYQASDRLICLVQSHNNPSVFDRVEVIIISTDQWLNDDKCWLYKAISTRTNQQVYVKEIDLSELLND